MEVTLSHAQVAVNDASQPSAARLIVRKIAGRAGFGEEDEHRAGIVATELATNLVKHAVGGEVLVRSLGAPFPGPVLGMGLLFAILLVRGRSTAEIDAVADTLLRNLSLLLVPAAVGVVQQAGLIAANWLAITAALLLSTLATLVVTVYTFRAVARRVEARQA